MTFVCILIKFKIYNIITTQRKYLQKKDRTIHYFTNKNQETMKRFLTLFVFMLAIVSMNAQSLQQAEIATFKKRSPQGFAKTKAVDMKNTMQVVDLREATVQKINQETSLLTVSDFKKSVSADVPSKVPIPGTTVPQRIHFA